MIMSFTRSFYALVSFYADLRNKETSFVYRGRRGFFCISDKKTTGYNNNKQNQASEYNHFSTWYLWGLYWFEWLK